LLVETLYKRHPLTLDNADDIQHAEAILGNLDAIKELIEAARQNTAPFTHGRRENRPTGQLGGRNRHSEPTKD
jgi:hypothetical protein